MMLGLNMDCSLTLTMEDIEIFQEVEGNIKKCITLGAT